MAASEIDDIFASKGKVAHTPSASSSTQQKKKKKKGENRKRESSPVPTDEAHNKPAKRRAPETVLDPSARLPAAAPKQSRASKPPKSAAGGTTRKKPKPEKEDEERFRDSRGTGPRRQTEEGFTIYKEDELGITDKGGDTPLCPFDCQCCF